MSKHSKQTKQTRKRSRLGSSEPHKDEGHFGGAVGHSNPPKSGQFKKGKSPNPGGRPKGSKNVRNIVREELKAMTRVTEITKDGKRKTKKKQPLEVILIKLRRKAMEGDLKAAKQYFDIMARFGDFEDRDDGQDKLSPEEQEILSKALADLGQLQSSKTERGGDDASD